MLAFAMVFFALVKTSIAGAFIGASLAWLVVSVTAWLVRRKTRLVRGKAGSAERRGPALPRRR